MEMHHQVYHLPLSYLIDCVMNIRNIDASSPDVSL